MNLQYFTDEELLKKYFLEKNLLLLELLTISKEQQKLQEIWLLVSVWMKKFELKILQLKEFHEIISELNELEKNFQKKLKNSLIFV